MKQETLEKEKGSAENATYSFAATIIAKVGSLFLTVVLARMLQPELFGIYSLVLSIVLIVFMFSDLGINSALNRYVSYFLSRKDIPAARSHVRYLLKIKTVFLAAATIAMILVAPIISIFIYKIPEMLIPLLLATIYIFVNAFRSFFESLYYPTRNLRNYPLTTGILHGLRLIIATVILALVSKELALDMLFVGFALASLISIIAVLLALGKRRQLIFGKINSVDTKRVNKYIGYMSIANISIALFGSVDTLMLGFFVVPEFVGYYRAALGLIVSVAAILSLSNIFIPYFTSKKKQDISQAIEHASKYLAIITFPATIGLILIGKYIIYLVYGQAYALALWPFYILALLILTTPFIKLYTSIFESQEMTKSIAKITLVSLGINIILNYLAIIATLGFGEKAVIAAVAATTLLSQIIYIISLKFNVKKIFNTKTKTADIIKPVIAATVMGLLIILFSSRVDINLMTGLIEVFIGIVSYFIILFLIKGIKKEDIEFVKGIVRK